MIKNIFLLHIFFVSVYFNSYAQTKKETEESIKNIIEKYAYSNDLNSFEYSVSFENCKLIIRKIIIDSVLSDTSIVISQIPINNHLEIKIEKNKPESDFEYCLLKNFDGVLNKQIAGKIIQNVRNTSMSLIVFNKIFLKESLAEKMVNYFSSLLVICGGHPLVEVDDESTWRVWTQKMPSKSQSSNTDDVIQMQKMESGLYEIPVMINDVLKISFIFDSGASDVSISPDVAATLMRTGTVKETDFIGSQKYSFGDGSTAINKRFIIRKLSIGNHVVTNVTATISNSINAPMLLGQSVQQKFGKITIDNTNHTIAFGK